MTAVFECFWHQLTCAVPLPGAACRLRGPSPCAPSEGGESRLTERITDDAADDTQACVAATADSIHC